MTERLCLVFSRQSKVRSRDVHLRASSLLWGAMLPSSPLEGVLWRACSLASLLLCSIMLLHRSVLLQQVVRKTLAQASLQSFPGHPGCTFLGKPFQA